MEYGIRAKKSDEIISAEMWTPIQNFKNLSIHGTLIPTNTDQYKIEGVLYRDMVTYNLNGIVHMNDGYPIKSRLQMKPLNGSSDGLIEINIKRKNDAFNYQFDAIEDGKKCQISGEYSNDKRMGLRSHVLVESTEPAIARIKITTSWNVPKKGYTTAKLSVETPWRDMGLENVNIWSDIVKDSDYGKINGGYRSDNHKGSGNCEWSWKPEEDIRLLIESSIERPNANSNFVLTELKFQNPQKSYKELNVGGKLNLSSIWNFEVNGTLNYISIDDIQVGVVTLWPILNNDTHELKGHYRGNMISQKGKNADVFVEGRYSATNSKSWCAASLTYRNNTDLHGNGHFEWGQADNSSVYEATIEMLRKSQARRELLAKLITPTFGNESTIFLIGSYDQNTQGYHNLNLAIDYPFSRRIADMDLAIQSFKNLNGYLNCTTPFLKTPWFKTALNFSTLGGNSHRYCQVDWPTDFCFIKLYNSYEPDKLSNIVVGNVELEFPLNTRHRGDIKYRLVEKPKFDTGNLQVFYNEKMIANGTYNRKEHNDAIFKETTEISLENEIKSIGIHFVNSSDWHNKSGHADMKRIEIFDLHNANNFNLTCELYAITMGSKKEIKLVAIHPNRTVILSTNYDASDNDIINHRSKLELSKTAWIGYNILVKNSNTDSNDARNFEAELSYPKRRLGIKGAYSTTLKAFNSNVSFEWCDEVNQDLSAVHTRLLWRTEELGQSDRDNQTIIFIIGHHLLEKDLELKSNFYRGINELVKANIIIDYSNDPEHLVEINALLKDLANEHGVKKYDIKFLAQHKASDLDVQFNGSATARSSYFKIHSNSLYKKDYFTEKHGSFLVLYDLNNKELEYMRKSPYRTMRLWMQPNMNYPIYGLNATLWNTPDTNNTGYVYLDVIEKEAHMYFNLTEDGSHNLLMFGRIPDARNSYIDIWRNYEEISIIDISSYIKLNHSRHLSGRFHWRPKIKKELKEKFNTIREAILNSFTENIDFWTKTLYMETISATGVVWDTTKRYNQEFINDIKQLAVLEEDLDDLRVFLNKSYEANDFYIKNAVNFTLSLMDEVALRDHIDSLPKIFSEIRQVLGQSGKALRKSILQLVEMIKTTYNNILSAINSFFHGHSLKYLTELMEKGFEKYEKFVKDMHISFLNHVEKMWNKVSKSISTYFKSLLKRLEPHIFKAMSFMEQTAWDLSKEMFNYINERTNELAESTYFNQVSSFTQDVENLYKDIKSHDAIVNIKKYSTIAWNFLKEKYYKLIPFGSELNEIIEEIWHEIKELEKIRQFQAVLNKFNEVATEVEWVAEEIKIKKHLHRLYALLCNKLRNYALNALEVADMYREAKTKFVFDPEEGVIDLEQKLPMSWHAFNETPKFQEIPEYKLLAQIQKLLTASNSSLLGHIYDIRSYLDLRTWLSPYYARAFLIDSRFYITYDKRFVSLNPMEFVNCTYVLSHDFWNNSFTLALDLSTASPSNYNELPVTKFSLIVKEHIFEIQLTTDTLTFNGVQNPMLPIKIDEIMVHRDLDILSINSENGFKFECNMQYNLCWFEVSGWYFGQTAGLLGTMNNEPFDDFTTPLNTIAKSNDIFVDAWSANQCSKKPAQIPSESINKKLFETCNQLFSSLSHCTSVVDPSPFLDICVELGNKSYRQHEEHSSLKGSCTAALAYIEVCQLAKIPMRVPQQCVFCALTNGTYVPETTFVEYKTNIEPRSTDIVFLVEAKSCNTYSTGDKSIGAIITALEEQLKDLQFINNRYAVVAFGAHASPFDYPRSISKVDGSFVNSTNELRQYFNHMKPFLIKDDGPSPNSDILQAISRASKLNFRPGVSKTFILLSCSRCDVKQIRFDYSSILQYMNEESVSMHILADIDFDFDKTRKMRHFFGFDKHFVYSNRFPEGDSETRHAFQTSKSGFGICTPLALETGGSIFSMKKILPERKNSLKRFATIFAKRVVQHAIPMDNQTCECTGRNTGVAYMVCASRRFPNQESSLEINDSDFAEWDWESEDYDLE